MRGVAWGQGAVQRADAPDEALGLNMLHAPSFINVRFAGDPGC